MAAKGVLLAALAAVVLPLALRTPLRGGWERRDLNDFTLNLRHSRTVAETRRYPYAFLYPPPAVVLRLGLGALGFEIGGALWIAGMAAGALAAGWILASLLEREIGPGRAALAVLLGFRFRRIGGDGLCESALLLLPMVFASPQLQPHQLVLAWPATVCLAAILLAPGQCQPVSRRLVAATALGVGFALLEFGPARPWRGVVVLSALAIWALALAWLTLLTPPTDRVRDEQGRSPD